MRYSLLWTSIFAILSCSPKTQPESKVVDESQAVEKTEVVEKPKIMEKKMPVNKTPDKDGKLGKLITAEIVSKAFRKKNGKLSTHTEFYVRRSIQDYFIKFCESKVSKEDVQKIIEQTGSKMLSLEIEIKKGEWDKCGDDPVQSRTGDYIIIHKINE